VDLPDVDKADLTEQADEEYCENCVRPMVLKKAASARSTRAPDTPTARPPSPIGGQQKSRPAAREKCRSAATNWR